MNSIEKLAEQFKKFPGIGSRQSKRFVYFLLTQNESNIHELSKLISELKNDISQCSSCLRFFKQTDKQICEVCSDPNIDKEVVMLVEKDVDFENIRKTGMYNGKFFILGGTIPILEREPTKRIRAEKLIKNIEQGKNELKEIILALSVNPEGENTLQYIKKILEPFTEKNNIKITTLGRGLSTGTELEYSDSDTLENALKNRS